MTYATGGDIQALDYNTFATLANGMNEIFADLHPGATTLPNASYGYGQTPALTAVSVGNNVAASEWAALFQTMRVSGTHQGTTVVPPLPSLNPITGDLIAAYNTPASAVTTLINTLRTNRYSVAVLQSTLTSGTNQVQPAGAKPWTSSLTFTYRADFGSWDNARYFFNSGGSLNLNGSYSPNTTPEDAQWIAMFATMSPLVFSAVATTPGSGTNAGTAAGFYGLTTSYQAVYQKPYGAGGAYTNSYLQLNAKLAAAAGTNGLIDFNIKMVDGDVTPNAKTSTTTYRIDNLRATGAVTYPGPAVVITAVGANSGFTAV
jgi:hypothetical protein